MRKENRGSARRSAALQVELQYKSGDRCSALIRNISPEGVYMETSEAAGEIGTELDLGFTLDGERWQIPGTVIHTNSAGIGVKFRQAEQRLFRIVTAPLPYPPTPMAGKVMLG